MCWSLEVSLATGIFVYLTAAFLIVRNAPRDRWNAIFLFVFGSMQWTEAYLWYVDQTEGLANLTANNRLGTMASFAVVMFEPLRFHNLILIQPHMIAYVRAYNYLKNAILAT